MTASQIPLWEVDDVNQSLSMFLFTTETQTMDSTTKTPTLIKLKVAPNFGSSVNEYPTRELDNWTESLLRSFSKIYRPFTVLSKTELQN